jgi:hypothetical protein
MFDKVSRLAERATDGLSRRGFFTQLGRIGLGALAFATFVGEAAAAQNSRWILNGGCCGGQTPYELQIRSRRNGDWVPIGCTTNGSGIGVSCAPSPNCCGGTGFCNWTGAAWVCYSDGFCHTAC